MEGRQAVSIFDLSNKLLGCNITSHILSDARYRYIRFKSSDIICVKSYDGSEIFLLPTDSPSLNLFFMRSKNLTEELKGESRRLNSDLYSKVEDILKVVYMQNSDKTPVPVNELWVPAFLKSIKWEIPWIEGYYIPSQTPIQTDMYIAKAYEEITVGLNVPLPAAGLLHIGKPKGPVLQEDTVMGIMHRKIDKILDLPLFVCLIEKEDMRRY